MGCVFKVGLGIVCGGFDYLVGVVAEIVAVEGAEDPPLTARVGNELAGVAVKLGDRTATAQGSELLGGGIDLKGRALV